MEVDIVERLLEPVVVQLFQLAAHSQRLLVVGMRRHRVGHQLEAGIVADRLAAEAISRQRFVEIARRVQLVAVESPAA